MKNRNREVTVSICGLVAGIIIGAGALSLGTGSTVAGSVIDVLSYWIVPENIENASPRYIQKSGVKPADPDTMNYPTLKEPKEPTSSSSAAMDTTPCGIAVSVAAKLHAAHDKFIPKNTSNTAMRASLKAAVEAAVTEYCKPAVKESAQDKVAPKEKAPVSASHCDRYKVGTIRYTQCRIEAGVTY